MFAVVLANPSFFMLKEINPRLTPKGWCCRIKNYMFFPFGIFLFNFGVLAQLWIVEASGKNL